VWVYVRVPLAHALDVPLTGLVPIEASPHYVRGVVDIGSGLVLL
jgi:hypothetical protein